MTKKMTARGKIIDTLMALFNYSVEEALHLCDKLEDVRPAISYNAMSQALEKLKGTKLSEADLVRTARPIEAALRKQKEEELKVQNWPALLKRSKRLREGKGKKRGLPGKMSRQDTTKKSERVKHWRG